MAFTTYTNDPLVKGRVNYLKNQLFTVADGVTYKAGTLLARDTATLKLIPYVKGGSTNGNGVVKYVLEKEVVATVTGDIKVNVIKKAYDEGLDFDQLVIQADGDNSNIDANVIDEMRTYNLEVENFSEESVV